jgi:hypothetical protein
VSGSRRGPGANGALARIALTLDDDVSTAFDLNKQRAQLEHFGNMEAPPSGGAKEVIYHDTCTTRYQKSMYHGMKVQAWDAYIWICL